MNHFKGPNTILVVDDEIGPRQALRMILQGSRYNVLTCDNAKEALDIISSREVDIVMLDIKMPGIDGLKLLKRVKSIKPDIEIAMVTAYPSTQGAIKALRYGAYDFVVKPFDKEEIGKVAHKGVIRRTQRKVEKDMVAGLVSEIYQKPSKKK